MDAQNLILKIKLLEQPSELHLLDSPIVLTSPCHGENRNTASPKLIFSQITLQKLERHVINIMGGGESRAALVSDS